MKKVIFGLALVFVALTLSSAVTVKYDNKDRKVYTFKVKIEGRTTEVKFDAKSNGKVTIQGNKKECIIFSKCGETKVKSGDELIIKDGCVKVK